MVHVVAPSFWQRVYELGVKRNSPGLFYDWMAVLQVAKLLLSFVLLRGGASGDASAKLKEEGG
jgi:hypothetical protein